MKMSDLPLTDLQEDHPAHYIANEMAWAHNSMLRGLNAIYLQAPHIPSEDAQDFQFFIASWAEWVLHHHKIEESEMFPAFQSVLGVAPGSLEHNVEQHHEFSGGLSNLHKYAKETPSTKYSGDHVQSLIHGFAKALRQHLVDEIDTLWAMDSVKSDTEHSAKLLEIYKHCENEAGKQDKNVVPPMVLGLCDKTFEGGNDWPKMPMGSAYFVHYLFGRKHRGAWRFLPCDTWRNPKPLQFLGGNQLTHN
jgi:hemerythrin-like domain-containing protein